MGTGQRPWQAEDEYAEDVMSLELSGWSRSCGAESHFEDQDETKCMAPSPQNRSGRFS